MKVEKEGESSSLKVALWGEVNPEKCSWRVTKVKVEISLVKVEEKPWVSLGEEVEEIVADEKEDVTDHKEGEHESEETEEEERARVLAGVEIGQVNPYASSRDWDRIDQMLKDDLDNDDKEGEAALNALFRQIYSNADEDTRRAMNKSFSTSGGTVLSTNWQEVSDKDYEGDDRVVPEGSEWRSYDGGVVKGGKQI